MLIASWARLSCRSGRRSTSAYSHIPHTPRWRNVNNKESRSHSERLSLLLLSLQELFPSLFLQQMAPKGPFVEGKEEIFLCRKRKSYLLFPKLINQSSL